MRVIFFAALIVVIQLSDAYLRRLAFRAEMSLEERKKSRRNLLLYGAFAVAIYSTLIHFYGMSAALYKGMLILGAIPWLIVFMLTVRRDFFVHIFIFGMAAVWSTIQHNWSAMITVTFFSDNPRELIFFHAALYPLLFILFLPLELRFFKKLLPPAGFFESYGRYIALFPLVIISGSLILWAQEPTVHSWTERFSRMYMPFVFFFFYRYTLTATNQMYAQRQSSDNVQRLREQLNALGEYNRLMQESREQVAVMRHDLRHSYRLIYMMLNEKRGVAAVKKYISTQEKLLEKTAIKNFCNPPLINAALSIYIYRAEKLGIKVRHKINLPLELNVDESDFALLISNLLENAINASTKQPFDRREISVAIQNVGEQFALEISNLCDEKVTFDANNFPRAARKGHGLGMASLKNFAEKYNAYTDFSQEAGVFKVTMYWQ